MPHGLPHLKQNKLEIVRLFGFYTRNSKSNKFQIYLLPKFSKTTKNHVRFTMLSRKGISQKKHGPLGFPPGVLCSRKPSGRCFRPAGKPPLAAPRVMDRRTWMSWCYKPRARPELRFGGRKSRREGGGLTRMFFNVLVGVC